MPRSQFSISVSILPPVFSTAALYEVIMRSSSSVSMGVSLSLSFFVGFASSALAFSLAVRRAMTTRLSCSPSRVFFS